MNNRIGLLLKVKDVTASRFAEMIGVQPSNISHILSGRNKPSLDFIIKVTETFPDISLEWLLFGRGSMFGQIENTSQNAGETMQDDNDNEPLDDSGVPDLFSQIQHTENLKIDHQTEQEVKDHEKNELSVSGDGISSETQIPDDKVDNIEESEEYLHETRKSEFFQGESIVKKDVVSMKPVKIIMVYPDDTFTILEEKEKN